MCKNNTKDKKNNKRINKDSEKANLERLTSLNPNLNKLIKTFDLEIEKK